MSAASASTAREPHRGAPGSSFIDRANAELLPATDILWRDVYHVVAPLNEDGAVRWWRAFRTDTAEEVVLRVAPGAENAAQVEAWKRLAAIELSHLQKGRELHFASGCSIQVCDPIKGTPLDAWRAARPSVDVAAIEAIVGQLSEALGVLQASGLVHLGLRPGSIFVREEKGALHVTLGGLETVSLFESDRPLLMPADPFYAPPEAATLEEHEAGPALCAWDWWSLGRVVQETILGHHVADLLPDSDASQSAPVRLVRAGLLLLEHDATGVRAGAVELMTGLEPRLDLLLRGLLASAPEARWAVEFVDRWLRRKSVKELYQTPRTDSKFRWRGRLHTVAEAAKALRTAELWEEAAAQVLDSGASGTLAHFIARSPEQEQARQSLDEVLRLAETEPLKSLPASVSRDLGLALALLKLAGGQLTWRGRRLDGGSLQTLLAEAATDADRFAFVRALTHRTITAQVDRNDFEAGRSLAAIGRVAAAAEAIIQRQGWPAAADDEPGEKIFRLALAPDADLQAARERLQRDFASSDLPAVDKFFQAAQPARAELVVLAWVEPRAAQSGLVTHAESQARRLRDLQARGGQVVAALFWCRLDRALSAGPAVFGRVWVFAAVWSTVFLLVAGCWPGREGLMLALIPVALAVVARVTAALGLAGMVRRLVPAAAAWKPGDGATRCRAEMQAVANGLEPAALEPALGEINVEIGKLALINPPPAPVAGPPGFGGLRGVALAGWILAGAVLVLCAWRAKSHPPSWSAVRMAWSPASSVAPAGTDAGANAAPVAAAAAGDASPAGGRSGMSAGAIKISWPFRAGFDTRIFEVVRLAEATSAQKSYATKRGREITAPYRAETIKTPIVLAVPADGAVAVMVYDGERGELADSRVRFLSLLPSNRSWIEVGDRRGIFLGD